MREGRGVDMLIARGTVEAEVTRGGQVVRKSAIDDELRGRF